MTPKHITYKNNIYDIRISLTRKVSYFMDNHVVLYHITYMFLFSLILTVKGHVAPNMFHDGSICEYDDDDCWSEKLKGFTEKRSNKYRWFIPY